MARRFPLGTRGLVLLAILAAGLWAAAELELTPAGLVPREAGLEAAGRFFAGAFSPALRSQAPAPFGGHSLLPQALEGARMTVVFAAGAIGLSLLVGLLLGFLGSTAWWSGDPAGGASRLGSLLRRTVAPAVYAATRVVITLMRSVHEVLWAILFTCAFGVNHFAAVIAIAIPYGGTLAKVYSEIIDEAPREPAHALRAAGASPLQVFLLGFLPPALPDMAAYALYRFECALRSAAVLGFFGIPTLGYYIASSFENLYYDEVWTYLYTLFLLVVLVEWWSGLLRQRFVA